MRLKSSWKRQHTYAYICIHLPSTLLHAYKNKYVVENYLWKDMCRCTVPSIISYGWASGIHELADGPQIISWECCTLETNFDVANWCDVAGGWCEWHTWEGENYEDALRVLVVPVAVFRERWVQFAKEGVWRKARRRESKRRSWMLKIEWKRVYLRYVRACRRWIQMKIYSERSSIFLCSFFSKK